MSLHSHIQGPDNARLTVVLLHGFGAPGGDLVPLSAELERLRPELRGQVRWVFPEALLPLPEGGASARAWWRIEDRFWAAVERGDRAALDTMRDQVPPGLPEARAALLELLTSLRSDAPLGRLALGGFSQGAMLSTDVGLRLEPPPQALLLFSGTLLNAPEWRTLAPLRSGLPVFQSHGREDPILPYPDAERLRNLLREGGMAVDFLPFRGGHTIPYAALERAAALLAECVIKDPP